MQIINETMQKQGLRAAELARRTGFHPSRLSRWLAGEGEPSIAQFGVLAGALGLTMDEAAGVRPVVDRPSPQEMMIVDAARRLGIDPTEAILRLGRSTPGSVEIGGERYVGPEIKPKQATAG